MVHRPLHVIRNTAYRPSTQASYTAGRLRPKKKTSCGDAYRSNTHNIISLMAPHDFSVKLRTTDEFWDYYIIWGTLWNSACKMSGRHNCVWTSHTSLNTILELSYIIFSGRKQNNNRTEATARVLAHLSKVRFNPLLHYYWALTL